MPSILNSRTILVTLLWSSVIVLLSAQPQIRVTSKGQIEHLNTGGSLFIGQQAGDLDDLSSNNNVFVGNLSGSVNTTGNQNSSLGHQALKSNTTGGNNVSIGCRSMWFNTTGSSNTVMGYESFRSNTTGEGNTALGKSSMFYNTVGDWNTALGMQSLPNNTTGQDNVALGYDALYENTTGNGNTVVGTYAGRSVTTVSGMSAFGHSSLRANIGTGNSAFGYFSMRFNTTGNFNTAMGYNALRSNITASSNTAVGNEALASNNSASANTAVGDSAMFASTSGGQNTAFGAGALQSAVGTNYNTAIGFKAMKENIAGINNIAIGSFTLQNGNVSFCTAIGNHSGKSDISGSQYNVYIGHYAGSKTSGSTVKSNNVMIGHESGSGNEGNGNVFIGYQSGKNETGSNKLYIENSNSTTPLIYGDFDAERVGIGISIPEDALSIRSTATDNALRVQVGTATKMRIFNNGSVSFGANNAGVSADDVYVHNQLGLGVSAPAYRLELPNNAANDQGKALANAWNVYSDQRVKTDVTPLTYGLDEVLALEPVGYKHHSSHFTDDNLIVDSMQYSPDIGFLAQDVAAIIKEIVSQPADESTALWSMNYEKLTPVLVKAIQEQQAIIDSLQKKQEITQHSLDALYRRFETLEANVLKEKSR